MIFGQYEIKKRSPLQTIVSFYFKFIKHCSFFQVGDQLLDVNGLNLRASSKDQAALVLQHAGNSITMKVQFNPGDYHSMLTLASSHEDERVSIF